MSVTALVVLLTILFLAGLFQDLSEPVLGAIVIAAVAGMLRSGKLTALRRARTPEFWAALGALLGVIVIDVFPGMVDRRRAELRPAHPRPRPPAHRAPRTLAGCRQIRRSGHPSRGPGRAGAPRTGSAWAARP
jgi:hypothetical protein